MQAASEEATIGWAPRIDGVTGPIYLAIANAIARAVGVGELRAGERLPTHRALADALGVDLTTVTRAYAEARKRGLLQATVGRGTFVRAATMPSAAPNRLQEGPVDLGMNLPPIPVDPPLQELLSQGLARVLATTEPSALLTYRSGSGTMEEREAGASWLRPVLGDVDPARVLLCPGAQPAITGILSLLAKPGDTVLTDTLTYPGLRTVAAQLGIRLEGVEADSDGMMPGALDSACRGHTPKALYCVPSIHNPTTVTMPLQRRQALVEVAARHDVPVIEDDAYGLLPSEPLPALTSLAPQAGFYVSTVSKIISPALRIAYVVAPDPRSAARLSGILRSQVLMASPLLTTLITTWVNDGTATAVVLAVRRESGARQKIAREILAGQPFHAHPEGLHLWLSLPPFWDRREFVAHLRRKGGLAVVPSDAFSVAEAKAPPDAVRVSLGAAPSREDLRAALRFVAEVARDEMPSPFSGIV